MQDLRRKRGFVVSAPAEDEWDAANGITVLPWAAIAAGDVPAAWLR